jgi:predicted site-specific integrase-resolvase
MDIDRHDLNKLIYDVINHRIKNIYISYKDWLTRLSFKTIQDLFLKFNTNIIIINQNSDKCNDNEIFEELMHIFTTTMYSNRRKNKINIFKNDIENFISND